MWVLLVCDCLYSNQALCVSERLGCCVSVRLRVGKDAAGLGSCPTPDAGDHSDHREAAARMAMTNTNSVLVM